MNNKIIDKLKNIIYEAGNIALKERQKGLIINRKSDNSPVSNADIKISQFIKTKIAALGLDYPLICEEQEERITGDSQYFWLIDPIDGTRSYIKNEDSFTVNIALIKDNKAFLGLILQPTAKKLYYTDASSNLIIEENGIIKQPNLLLRNDDSLIAIVSSHHFNRMTEKFINQHNFSKIISIPSSIKLCFIAEGVGDIYPKFGPSMEWDIAAGHALIKAAGGNIEDLSGDELIYGKYDFKNSHFHAFGRCYPRR